jgi:dTDP-4-dehydrorhamnose reductase
LYGELAVAKAWSQHLVLRTSWIFGAHPTQAKSYVHTVLKVARSGKDLKATTDQVSVPTYASDLAQWTFELLELGAAGLIHAVNDEPISRFDWTRVIVEEARTAGVLDQETKVEAVTTAYFNPTIRRPAYSAMDNSKATAILGRKLGSWRAGLRQMLREPIHFA